MSDEKRNSRGAGGENQDDSKVAEAPQSSSAILASEGLYSFQQANDFLSTLVTDVMADKEPIKKALCVNSLIGTMQRNCLTQFKIGENVLMARPRLSDDSKEARRNQLLAELKLLEDKK